MFVEVRPCHFSFGSLLKVVLAANEVEEGSLFFLGGFTSVVFGKDSAKLRLDHGLLVDLLEEGLVVRVVYEHIPVGKVRD